MTHVRAGEEFFNFHNHDMVRVAVAIPAVRVANPVFNGEQTIALMRQAAERHAALVLFPELGLPGYSCEDLHQQRVMLDGCAAALGGATVLLNPSGSPVTVAKADYRRALVENQSARCMAAYLYAGAGAGESTTDLAWDGQGLICENGNLLATSRRFSLEPQLVC